MLSQPQAIRTRIQPKTTPNSYIDHRFQRSDESTRQALSSARRLSRITQAVFVQKLKSAQ